MSGSSLYCKFSQRCVFIVGPLGQARVHIEITGGLVRKNADTWVLPAKFLGVQPKPAKLRTTSLYKMKERRVWYKEI